MMYVGFISLLLFANRHEVFQKHLSEGKIIRTERVGFEPTVPKRNNGFRDRPIQPLSHLSITHQGQTFARYFRAQEDLNLRPLDPQSNALSTELWAPKIQKIVTQLFRRGWDSNPRYP